MPKDNPTSPAYPRYRQCLQLSQLSLLALDPTSTCSEQCANQWKSNTSGVATVASYPNSATKLRASTTPSSKPRPRALAKTGDSIDRMIRVPCLGRTSAESVYSKDGSCVSCRVCQTSSIGPGMEKKCARYMVLPSKLGKGYYPQAPRGVACFEQQEQTHCVSG